MKLFVTSVLSVFAASGFTSDVAAQPTSSRLAATCAYTNQGGYLVPADSQKYNYPSGYTRLDSMVNRITFSGGMGSPYYNYAHTYDASGFRTGEIITIWNAPTATFKPSTKFQYLNDAKGNLVDKLYLSWVASTSSYLNTQHYTYARDANGNVVEYVQQIWNSQSAAWRNVSRDSSTYNAQNMVTKMFSQNWMNSGPYVNNYRHDYTYDASGTGMLTDTFRWLDVPTGGWRNYGVTTYTLNASGKPTSGIMRIWNASTNVYEDNYEHYTYSYDALGNEISRIVIVWNPPTSTFVNSYQDAHTFNSFNQIKTFSHSYWNGTAFTVYASSTKTIYYYENYVPAAVSPQHAGAPQISLSPNPAKDVLAIKLQSAQDFTATISDMQGRIYQKFSGAAAKAAGINISVAEMPAGNYILSVKGENGAGSTRIISVMH